MEWAAQADTGDRAELAWEPSPAAWSQLSVGSRECPGAARCPSGAVCFAEAARARAAQADVVVVNTHLYAAALAAGGDLLPPHDLVVFDEAHELEDIASAALGFEIGAGRFQALARTARPDPRRLLGLPPRSRTPAGLLGEALHPHLGALLPRPLDDATRERLTVARERVQRLQADIRRAARSRDEAGQTGLGRSAEAARGRQAGLRARQARVQQAAGHLLSDLDQVLELSDSQVAWVEGPDHAPVLKVAPLDVGAALQRRPVEPRRCSDRGDDQRHHSPPARRAARSGAGLLRRARRRQPLRLRRPGPPLLPGPPGGTPASRLRGRPCTTNWRR